MDGVDKTRAALDERQAALAQESRTYQKGGARLDELIAQYDQFTADREQELQALVAAGDVTPSGAKTIRSWFAKPELLALPAPGKPQPMPAAPGGPHAPNGAGATSLAPEAFSAPTPLGTRPAAAFAGEPAPPPVEPAEVTRVAIPQLPDRERASLRGGERLLGRGRRRRTRRHQGPAGIRLPRASVITSKRPH